jgi:hypothetical protein
MGWFGHGIYDGDETQTQHLDFIKWAKIEKQDAAHNFLKVRRTVLPKEKIYLLNKNSGLILKRMKKLKDVDSAISWQMLLSLYIDNKIIPNKKIIKQGILATKYLMGQHASEYDNPHLRRRNLRNFIKRVDKVVGNH